MFIKPLFYTSLLEINWKLFFLTPWDYFFNQVKICLFFTFNFSFLTWVVHLYLFLLPSIKEHELKLKQIKITFLLFYFILNNVLFYFYLLPSYWKFFLSLNFISSTFISFDFLPTINYYTDVTIFFLFVIIVTFCFSI